MSQICVPPRSTIECNTDCIFCKMAIRNNLCNTKYCIYIVRCKHCNQIYVGETKRLLKKRIHEHLYSKSSAVYTHWLIQHSDINIVDCFVFDILHKNAQYYKHRIFVEAHYIRMYNGYLMNGCESVNLQYTV